VVGSNAQGEPVLGLEVEISPMADNRTRSRCAIQNSPLHSVTIRSAFRGERNPSVYFTALPAPAHSHCWEHSFCRNNVVNVSGDIFKSGLVLMA